MSIMSGVGGRLRGALDGERTSAQAIKRAPEHAVVRSASDARHAYVTLADGTVVAVRHASLAEAKALLAAQSAAERRVAAGIQSVPVRWLTPPTPDQLLLFWATEAAR